VPQIHCGCRDRSCRGQLSVISRQSEAMMSRVITLDKGSKQRMRQIRWKIREIISLILLSLMILILGVLLAIWEVSRYSAAPQTPQLEARPDCDQNQECAI
jgi:hypothetical protein